MCWYVNLHIQFNACYYVDSSYHLLYIPLDIKLYITLNQLSEQLNLQYQTVVVTYFKASNINRKVTSKL